VVRGDPLADPQLLADQANILAVFKDGVAYKLTGAAGGRA
jgi:hypothetical protein